MILSVSGVEKALNPVVLYCYSVREMEHGMEHYPTVKVASIPSELSDALSKTDQLVPSI